MTIFKKSSALSQARGSVRTVSSSNQTMRDSPSSCLIFIRMAQLQDGVVASVEHTGYLHKRGEGGLQLYRRRYFVLRGLFPAVQKKKKERKKNSCLITFVTKIPTCTMHSTRRSNSCSTRLARLVSSFAERYAAHTDARWTRAHLRQ